MKNVGSLDAMIRGALGAAALVVAAAFNQRMPVAIVAGLFGLVMLVTAVTGYCPLYSLIHVNTRGGSSGARPA